MINQLFVDKPPESLIITCITLLGWSSLTDNRILIRKDLDSQQIGIKFATVLNNVKDYYLPCKQEKYLGNMSTKSVITIVRQLLKTIGYNIRGIERVMDNKKEMIYKLEPYNKNKPVLKKENPNHILQNTSITRNGQSKFIVSWN
jgi:hypothetical protein